MWVFAERTSKASLIHGKYKSRIHKEWRGILHRCKNPSASHYENYGDNDKGYSPENCRWITHQENCWNRGKRTDCKTTHSGVAKTVFKSGNVKYRATIGVNYKTIHLGYFDTEKEAVEARITAEEKYWNKKAGD